MKKQSDYSVYYDAESGKPVVVIAGVDNYDKARSIANKHFKVSVGFLTVCFARIEADGTVTYDVAKKDANAVAIIKEEK